MNLSFGFSGARVYRPLCPGRDKRPEEIGPGPAVLDQGHIERAVVGKHHVPDVQRRCGAGRHVR
jgi:hypothetical protein